MTKLNATSHFTGKKLAKRQLLLFGYARVSSTRQKDEYNSLESQMERIRTFSKEIGADLHAIGEDHQSGGDNPLSRPGLLDLVRDAVSARDLDPAVGVAIMVGEVDRLGRSTAVLSLLRKNRLPVYVVGRGKIGRDELHGRLVDASLCRDDISRKAAASHKARSQMGRKLSAPIDAHVSRRGSLARALIADDRDRRLFEHFRLHPACAELTHRELAEHLNKKGVFNQISRVISNRPWTKDSIKKLRARHRVHLRVEQQMDDDGAITELDLSGDLAKALQQTFDPGMKRRL